MNIMRTQKKNRSDVEEKKPAKTPRINEWQPGLCGKPEVKCAVCSNRQFLPVTNEIISYHLKGESPSTYPKGEPQPFVMGIYPLLPDETCYFLALDFDKENWEQDTAAFMKTCETEGIPAYLERSRSGNGGHIWIFFDEVVSARLARSLGSALLTKSLDQRPEIGLDSFDRFFPNQDTLPKGGSGNLIALPLQKRAREKNHSVFLNQDFQPSNSLNKEEGSCINKWQTGKSEEPKKCIAAGIIRSCIIRGTLLM